MKRNQINWIETQAMIVDTDHQHIADQYPLSVMPTILSSQSDEHTQMHGNGAKSYGNIAKNGIFTTVLSPNSAIIPATIIMTSFINSNNDTGNGENSRKNRNYIRKFISVSDKILPSPLTRVTRQIHSKLSPISSSKSMQTNPHRTASRSLSSSPSSSLPSSTSSLISQHQQIQPNFDHHRIKRNFTIPLGGTGYLQCRINNLADKTVSRRENFTKIVHNKQKSKGTKKVHENC